MLHAQNIEITPANVSVVDGRSSLERDGQVEQLGGGMPFVPGDRLRTEAGRVEILFPDGSALDVDEFTSVELMSPTLLRVTSGRVLLVVFGAGNPSSAVRYQIDTPSSSARTDGPGEYRVSLFNGSPALQTELAVTRGWAALSNEAGTTPVRAGERTLAAEGQAPTPPQIFNSARFDAFDRWVAAQRGDRTATASSGQYLPNDLRVYSSDFDRYGSWGYEASYGNVWYPTVAPGWRPYYDGYWSSVPSYGWTWIGSARWSWPTHHYGRWGYHGNRWFWVPGRHWAPAWVSWGVAPGYVSWCPLGFNNQPVFALTVGFGNFWAGWTAVPRTHFAKGHVGQWAVAPHRLGGAPFARSAAPPVPVPGRPQAAPRVVVNGSQTAPVVPPSFGNRQPNQPRAELRPRNPQSLAERTTTGQAAITPAAPSLSRGDRRGGWVVPRQPAAAPGNEQTSGSAPRVVEPQRSPGAFQRQPAVAPIVPQPNRGEPGARTRNPYMPRSENPYAPNEQGAVPRWTQPGVPARRSTPGDATVERPTTVRPQKSQSGAVAPRSNGRENSNPGVRQGSVVPRNESGGNSAQQGNSAGQQSSGGGAHGGGATRQGQGSRQRHP